MLDTDFWLPINSFTLVGKELFFYWQSSCAIFYEHFWRRKRNQLGCHPFTDAVSILFVLRYGAQLSGFFVSAHKLDLF